MWFLLEIIKTLKFTKRDFKFFLIHYLLRDVMNITLRCVFLFIRKVHLDYFAFLLFKENNIILNKISNRFFFSFFFLIQGRRLFQKKIIRLKTSKLYYSLIGWGYNYLFWREIQFVMMETFLKFKIKIGVFTDKTFKSNYMCFNFNF